MKSFAARSACSARFKVGGLGGAVFLGAVDEGGLESDGFGSAQVGVVGGYHHGFFGGNT